MPPPAFSFAHVISKTDWNNFHGTVAHRSVPTYVILDPLIDTGTAEPRAKRHGTALKEILTWCFDNHEPLRAIGATWSLSNIVEPTNVIIDNGAMNGMARVKPAWITAAYKVTAPDVTPVAVESGTHISHLNTKLGEIGLALKTTGASDGHRIAGCIATGTHGSALKVGAVHDTVLALFVLTAPDKAWLLQPENGPFTDDLAKWFEAKTGFPTASRRDDDLFSAAQVGLGSMGFVHTVVIETVPLYRLQGRMVQRPLWDAAVWDAVRTMDTRALHPDVAEVPFHFSLLVDPYSSPGLYVGFWWKANVGGVPFTNAPPVGSMIASDCGRIVASLVGVIDGGVGGAIVELVISSNLRSQNPDAATIGPVFPGQAFGPTSLPPGFGKSTEIVVDQKRAVDAMKVVIDTLKSEATKGRHLLGAMGVRFAPKTHALLGMNVHDMSCYMELGSMDSGHIRQIHDACWNALDAAGIPYTCHWGQEHRLDAAHVKAYFGVRAARWTAARNTLLPTATARGVFAAKTLALVGL